MPRIIVIRHAHAQWPRYRGSDFDRPLTPRGLQQAQATGRAIKAAELNIKVILASPASRTRKTAEIIARELGMAPKQIRGEADLYNATADVLATAAEALLASQPCIAVVAHNPGISEFARRLAQDPGLPAFAPADWKSFDVQKIPI
jgi:phosphohistidine phosphatase